MGDIPGGWIISQTVAASGSIDRVRYRTDKPMQPEDERPSRALLLPIISRADRGETTPGWRGERSRRARRPVQAPTINNNIPGRTPMLTRRSMMLASIAAGVTMNNRTASAKAAQPATPVNFDVPAGACDCHTHIHPDPGEIPVLCRPGLYARTGVSGGNDRAAQGAEDGARGDRHAEHLRPRQLRDPVRDGGTRARPRAGSP